MGTYPRHYTPGMTYPLGDVPTAEETGGAPFKERMVLPSLGVHPRGFRAAPTGEKRVPEEGEWYLSGADVTAYRASNRIAVPFMIARLVRVEMKPAEWVVVSAATGT